MKASSSAAVLSPPARAAKSVASSADTPANHNAVGAASADLARRLEATRAHLAAIRALWPDLHALSASDRRASNGRLVGRFSPALRVLFEAAADPAFAPAFALVLGGQNDGIHDASAFAAEAARVDAIRAVSAELRDLDALLTDDLLHHGARIMTPGLRVLELTHTLAKSNAAFRARVAPALRALREMTASTRRKQTAPVTP